MKKKHFYIEISVVLIVFGLLLLVSIPRFLGAQNMAKITRAKKGLNKIETAIKIFKTDKGSYPKPLGSMTNPGVFSLLLNSNYITRKDIKDPFLGQGELTNDSDSSSFFFTLPQRSMATKYPLYNTTTSKYRGNLPGAYQYHIGSCGPDKVINLDNPPRPKYTPANAKMVVQGTWVCDVFIDYDSSNGLISDGDIHLFGPE